jgi:hypothetical protein
MRKPIKAHGNIKEAPITKGSNFLRFIRPPNKKETNVIIENDKRWKFYKK